MPVCRENSKIPLVASPQLETDVKGLQRTLANLQGTSRALHQLERHHEGLKADLQQYKAAMQESTARRDLGTFKYAPQQAEKAVKRATVFDACCHPCSPLMDGRMQYVCALHLLAPAHAESRA